MIQLADRASKRKKKKKKTWDGCKKGDGVGASRNTRSRRLRLTCHHPSCMQARESAKKASSAAIGSGTVIIGLAKAAVVLNSSSRVEMAVGIL